jgi:AcrR family transcriptional regulator
VTVHPRPEKKDRRVQRTHTLLRDALASLIGEKDLDSIVVKEILHRANVGRSTFYAHFRDKDELFDSAMRDVVRSVPSKRAPSMPEPYERLIRFSLPIFEFVDLHRHNQHKGDATAATDRSRPVAHEHLQHVITGLIADDLRKAPGRRKKTSRIPQDLLVQYLASTFILVLNWWADSSPLPAGEIDAVFRAMVLPTLTAGLE